MHDDKLRAAPFNLDTAAIDKVKKEGTVIVGPPAVAEKLPGIVVLKNGDSKDFGGFSALAVPMYVFYEASILIGMVVARRKAKALRAATAATA